MDKARDILKRAGLKETKGRLLVLRLLIERKRILSIEDIQYGLKSNSPDKVTLYRMMEQFEGAEIIRKVDFKEGFQRYEYQGDHDHDHHHHIVCSGCERIEHVEDQAIENALRKITKHSKSFMGEIDHSLEFFGVCNSCKK